METTSDSQIAVTCEQQPESSSERAPMEVLDVEQGQPNAEEEEEEGEVPVDEPPEYEELQLDEATPPIDYETLVALDQSPKPTGTLMVEAPPSYKQLFGAKDTNQVEGVRRTRIRGRTGRRAHTVARRQQRQADTTSSPLNALMNRFPSLSKGSVAFIFVGVLLLCLTIPVAMLTIGFLNVHTCDETQVPLYLIIAGFVIGGEVIVHSLLCVAAAKCEGTGSYRTLRLCDCLAFFLLVWLLIGSNWIFKLSITGGHKACEVSDAVTIPPSTLDFNNSAVLMNDYAITTATATTMATAEICDCSQSVYVFATVVIVMQYVLALIVVIGCCSKVWKNNWGSNSD